MKVIRVVQTKTTTVIDGAGTKTTSTTVDLSGSKEYNTEETDPAVSAAVEEAIDEFDKSMDLTDLGDKIDQLMKDAFKPFDRLSDRLRNIGRAHKPAK